jgi:hypothetical protein
MKPIVSCVCNAKTGLYDSELVKKARENILEFLLLNHLLDCPLISVKSYREWRGREKFVSNIYLNLN